MHIDVLRDLRIPADWGLEIGVLTEVYRNHSTNRVCQVEVADNYDHKHQELSLEDSNKGLSRMSVDITKSLFRILATLGFVFEQGTVRGTKASYLRIALDLMESYHDDARMNGLHFDRDSEERAVELFAANVLKAGRPTSTAVTKHPISLLESRDQCVPRYSQTFSVWSARTRRNLHRQKVMFWL